MAYSIDEQNELHDMPECFLQARCECLWSYLGHVASCLIMSKIFEDLLVHSLRGSLDRGDHFAQQLHTHTMADSHSDNVIVIKMDMDNPALTERLRDWLASSCFASPRFVFL